MTKILYFDTDIVVCVKPARADSEKDMPELIRAGFKEKGIKKEKIFPLHRLDKPVGGIMIYALNEASAAGISEKIAKGTIKKEYLAVIQGIPDEESGIFEDLLFKDSRQNKSYVVKRERKGVKKASLWYEVIDKTETFSLVKVKLNTGRSHQIRVQFASRKMPLAGDGKYGSKMGGCDIALFSYKITLESGKVFEALPPAEKYPWNMFGLIPKHISNNE